MQRKVVLYIVSVLVLVLSLFPMAASASDGGSAIAAEGSPPKSPASTPHGIYRGVSTAVKFDVSPPLSSIAPLVPQESKPFEIPERGTGLEGALGPQDADAALQTTYGPSLIPAPSVSFNGPGNISGVSPPDPVGDVGPNHYVAMSNLSFQIFNKAGGSLYGPALNNTLWAGFGGDCQTDNAGDPIVLYDQISDRWMLSQFTASGPTYFNCVAVSQTPDPTGAYYRWAFSNGTNFPDYPKYGFWSDALYISTRDFAGGATFTGIGAIAINRAQLIAGNPAPTMIMFQATPASAGGAYNLGDGLLPSDLDGSTLPPAGTPNFFMGAMDNGGPYGAPQDALTLWKFTADFATPANSTFVLANTIPIAAYDTIFPCSPTSRNCIPQPGTANKIDILSYRQRPMHRLAYRNFGTHQSLVTNQSVEAAANMAGIRWWEIRSPNSSPVLYQDSTYAPGIQDTIHRWMGSIAQDSAGNMALGYSASNGTTTFPSVWYTGRLAGDPVNTMPQGEGSIINGTGSQTGSGRWGDYTSMNIDPVDDCTFWYVNQWVPTTSSVGWQLRIGAFRFPGCGAPPPIPNINVAPASLASTQAPNTTTSQTLNVGNTGGGNLTWSVFEDATGSPELVDWSDNFDSYATGSQLIGQGGWEGWDNNPAAGALTSSAQALSAPNSAAVLGATDLVHQYSGYTSGQWVYTARQYIPAGFTGRSYFILLNTYAPLGTNNWSTQLCFDATSGLVKDDVPGDCSGATGLPLVTGQWVEVRVEIDLTANTQAVYYNNQLLFQDTWTDHVSGGGSLNIAAVDLFANNASTVYYDDMSLVAAGGPAVCDAPADIPWASVNPTAGTTPGGGTTPVNVTFDSTGLAIGTYTGNLCVDSNDPDPGPGNGTDQVIVPIQLVVEQQGNPAIELNKTVGTVPGVCATTNKVTVPAGTEVYYCYQVENTGAVTLTYHSLVDTELGVLATNLPYVLAPGTFSPEVIVPETITITTTNVATWTAVSTLPFVVDDTIPYNWQDISATGTAFTLGDDQVSPAFPVGFGFDYFGTSYSNIYVSSNGFLTVLSGQSNGCCTGDLIPDPADPNGVIAGWWEDLDPGEAGAGLYYQTLGSSPNRVFIVQFSNVQHFPSGTPVSFEFKLFENSDVIEVHYQTAPSDGGMHSAGAENQDGTVGVQYHYGTAGLPERSAVRYTPVAFLAASDSDFAEVNVLYPNIFVDPLSLSSTQLPNVQTQQTLTVANTGDGDLTWNISEELSQPVARPVAPGSSPTKLRAPDPIKRTAEELRALVEAPTSDLVQDGSFEAGTPNPFWTEFSTNYGTPLCDVVGCSNLGGGTGPLSGTWWTWFGGTVRYEAGSMSQSVTIPSGGPAILTFWAEQVICSGDSADYLEVNMDGTQLWVTTATDPACGRVGYRQIRLDVSAYADDAAHTLEFNSEIFGSALTNFFVDDVVLGSGEGGVCSNLSDVPWLSEVPTNGTTAPGASTPVQVTFDSTGVAAGTYTANLCIDSNDPDAGPGNETELVVVPVRLIVTVPTLICNGEGENFDTTVPPPGWSVATNEPNGTQWLTLANCGELGNYASGNGGAACASGLNYDDGPFDTELRSPLFSLVGYTGSELNFQLNFQSWAGIDRLSVDITNNGGATWTTVRLYTTDQGVLQGLPGVNVNLDLGPWAGQANLMLRWRYYSTASSPGWYAQVDEVKIKCSAPPPTAVSLATLDAASNSPLPVPAGLPVAALPAVASLALGAAYVLRRKK